MSFLSDASYLTASFSMSLALFLTLHRINAAYPIYRHIPVLLKRKNPKSSPYQKDAAQAKGHGKASALTCKVSALIRAPTSRLQKLGLALFTVIGAQKALNFGTPGLIAVIMGTMTGVAGGMIRDVLAREVPMVLQKEIYATACILGGILYTLALEVNVDRVTAMLISMLGVFGLRVAAIYWHLSLPTFSLQRH